MEYTKEEVVQKLVLAYKTCSKEKNLDEIPVSSIIKKTSFKQDERNEIFKLFNLHSYEEILLHTNLFDVFSPQGKTHKVAKMKQKNAPTEEKTMAENETKSEKLHDRIQKIRDALSEGLIEKEDVVRLLLLTAIAGESSFLLGAPGCGKSMLARRMALAFKVDGENGVKYFETLLNQFSTPEDVFGNISLKALNGELEECKGKEEYRRLTENMLPEADIAFLDEIWKASPAILNTLLTIINERKFHNGSKVMDVSLKALFAASNELPAKNKGLEALYDRFVLRLCVGYIKDEDSFFEMIDGSSSSEFELSDEVKKLQITNEELKAWKEKIDAVSLSDEAKAVISAIRKELVHRNNNMGDEDKKNGELFEVGDRRWKKIAHILKTSAFLNDREQVDLMDCQLIEYCIWSTEKQFGQVRDIVKKCIEENGLDCDSAIDEINEQIEEFKSDVDEQWFEETKEPVMYKMSDGQTAYKIISPVDIYSYQSIKPFYLCENYEHDRYPRYGAYYDGNKDFIGDYDYYFEDDSFKIEDDIATWTDGYTNRSYSAQIEMNGTDVQKKFSDIAHETLQKNFDKAHYAPIVDRINNQIEELKAQKEKDAIPFKANLFANQEYNESITAKLDNAIKELQDAKVSLDKKRNCYFKPELAATLVVGDVILKNGTIYTADEIAGLSDDEKANVIAVVCIVGEKTYAMGLEQYEGKWDEIASIAADYGKENSIPSEFAQNWIVPDKDLLNEIFANKDLINKSLKAIGEEIEVLAEEEYWSSTENGDSAAFFQIFDESGEQDDTTKTHEYSVFVIREWKKS